MDHPNGIPGAAGRFRPAVALAAALLVAGCLGGPDATRSPASPDRLAGGAAQPELDGKGEVVSPLIHDLRLRQSVLPAGSSFDRVADSVLRAGAASAEAELRVKRLSARAKSKNWLPKIGPDVNLSSLGSIAADLLLDTALFDNGRRKAERDYAAADVEVAAVSLASDLNTRVYDGLKLYLEAQRATELAAITQTGLTRMADFERIMRIRTEGGLSDRSEYRVITQKQAEMEATLSSEREGAQTAMAELNALAAEPMDGVTGLSSLPPDPGNPQPLSVLLARAESARTLAEVKVARAGLKAGIGAGASIDKSGDLDAGLSLDGDILGFGRKDTLQALDATEDVALRRVEEADRDAGRKIVAREREIAALTAEQAKQATVVTEMEANLALFTEQYKAGGRTLLELVGQFESVVDMKRDLASVKYQIALARVEIALLRGVLVDGGRM